VVALIAGFVLLYKKSETFRNLIHNIGEAGKAAFDAIINAVKTVINWVKTNWPLLLAIITGPFGLIILAIVKNWDTIKGFIAAAIGKIIEIGKTIWDWILTGLNYVWGLVKAVWDIIVSAVKAYISLVTTIGKTIWDWILTAIKFVWGLAKGVFNTIVDFIKAYISTVASVGSKIWDWIVSGIKAAWELGKGVFNTIVEFIKGLGGRIASVASGMWDGLKGGLSSVLSFINKGINIILKGVNLLIDGLNAVNPFDDIPKIPLLNENVKLARGGVVRPTPGGTHAIIGEAGRPERVEPLDRNGLSVRDKAIILALAEQMNGKSSGAKAPTIIVNPSQGMDEVELSYQISRRMAATMKRGA
jgi:hypothetical protein